MPKLAFNAMVKLGYRTVDGPVAHEFYRDVAYHRRVWTLNEYANNGFSKTSAAFLVFAFSGTAHNKDSTSIRIFFA